MNFRSVALAVSLTTLAATAIAQHKPDEVIEYRQSVMTMIG